MKDFWLAPDWPAPSNVFALSTVRETDEAYMQRLPKPPVWLKQVHGSKVICVDQLHTKFPEADAAFSILPDTVCAVRTADCLPILLCDRQGSQVAALHAGWRGLASGVVRATCAALGTDRQEFLAWLGPAIGPQAFEVGQDVINSFLEHGWDEEQLNSAYQNGKLDIYALARLTLQQCGLPAENIYGGVWCTYSDPGRFYSYRRSKDTGRMASLIWRR